MSKRKGGWTEQKIERYIKEGRGHGELSEYIPWVKVQDLSSKGNSTRFKGFKTNRQHDFLSNFERDYFLILEWEDSVYDIREQFPLQREETIKIAEEKGISHSIDKETDTFIPMTTDFFITVKKNNKFQYLARTVKPMEELRNPRVIEKFEIEREYWERKGISWGIVTEGEINRAFSKNINWVHKSYYLNDKEDEKYARIFLQVLRKSANEENLQNICDQFDEDYNLEIGSAITYLKHLIARKLIILKMDETAIIVARLSIKNIKINSSKEINFDYISS